MNILFKSNLYAKNNQPGTGQNFLDYLFYPLNSFTKSLNQIYQNHTNMQAEDENWKPLESNPEVMNEFMKNLGFNTDKYAVQDLYTTEEWAQQMLPKPIFGLIFLYEINQKQTDFKNEEAKKLNETNNFSENLFFMKQYAKNACGTIALFHVALNAKRNYPDVFQQGSYLDKFHKQTKGKTQKQIGEIFKKSKNIQSKHKQSVNKGQSEVKDQVQTHFIAFVCCDGHIYELDGGKKCPINHGECKPEELVSKACEQIHKFINRDPENNQFTMLAVGAKPEM